MAVDVPKGTYGQLAVPRSPFEAIQTKCTLPWSNAARTSPNPHVCLLLRSRLRLRLRHRQLLIGAEQPHLYTAVLGARSSIVPFVGRFLFPQSNLLDSEHRNVVLRNQVGRHMLGPAAA